MGFVIGFCAALVIIVLVFAGGALRNKDSRLKSFAEETNERAQADLAAVNAALEAAEESVRVIRKYSDGDVLSDGEQALLIGAIERATGSVVDPIKLRNEMEAKAQLSKATRDPATPGSKACVDLGMKALLRRTF